MADGYRVEVSANNRAGCQDTLCKQQKAKILKGEIRFGVFVSGSANGHEYSGFKWRHWGCVSGKTMESIRHQLQKYGDGTNFNWEYLDGLEEMPSDYQEKIKTAIIEGKIADEDWNGDPAYNVLGKLGIRPRASAKKNREDEEKNVENVEIETPSKPSAKKRGRAIRDDDEDNEEQKAKLSKRRAAGVKKEEDEEEEKVKPAKRRATGVKKDDDDDEEEKFKPAKSRKVEVKREDDDGNLASVPRRKPTAKKGAKNQKSYEESSVKEEGEEVEIEAELKPARVKNGAKMEQDAGLASEENGTKAKTMPVRKGLPRAAKKEIIGDESETEIEAYDAAIKNEKLAKGSRGKKAMNQEASGTVAFKTRKTAK